MNPLAFNCVGVLVALVIMLITVFKADKLKLFLEAVRDIVACFLYAISICVFVRMVLTILTK